MDNTEAIQPQKRIDWNLAKALRAQGIEWAEIADRVGTSEGTLRVKASRQGWSKIHKQTANVLADLGVQTMAKVIQEQAPKAAEQWLKAVQEDTVTSIEAIRKLPTPKNLRDMATREKMMVDHVKRGRSAFGLDDAKGGTTVNFMTNLVNFAEKQGANETANETLIDVTDAENSDKPLSDSELQR